MLRFNKDLQDEHELDILMKRAAYGTRLYIKNEATIILQDDIILFSVDNCLSFVLSN